MANYERKHKALDAAGKFFLTQRQLSERPSTSAKKKAIARKMSGQPLKEWQESHFTSNPRLAKKHGIKLREN